MATDKVVLANHALRLVVQNGWEASAYTHEETGLPLNAVAADEFSQ